MNFVILVSTSLLYAKLEILTRYSTVLYNLSLYMIYSVLLTHTKLSKTYKAK